MRESKQEHLKATRIDFYALLGLEKSAGESEIKKAYFKKSKEFHPDRWVNLVNLSSNGPSLEPPGTQMQRKLRKRSSVPSSNKPRSL